MTDVALSTPYNAFGEVQQLSGRGDGTFSAPISFAAPDRTAAELSPTSTPTASGIS